MSVIDLKLKTYEQLQFEITKLNTDIFLKDKEIERLNNKIQDLQADYGNKAQVERDLLEEENKRLNNIIKELENLIKEDITTNLCEIENKRIGYGQTEVDKIWLKNLWGFKKYIISKCNEILDKGDEIVSTL